MDFTRLFDLPHYQKELQSLPDCLAAKRNGVWKKWSTDDVIRIANKLSSALLNAGVRKNDKIALVSNSRPEWTIIDLAIQQTGAILVPVYPTISEREYAFIFNDASIKIVFAETIELCEKLDGIKSECPDLEKIYSIDKNERWPQWDSILTNDLHNDLESIKNAIHPHDLATILYTSGTTGNPKGVMLSHYNIISNIKATISIIPFELGKPVFSFLPLSHIFERMTVYGYLAVGNPVYFASNLDTIAEEIKEIKPYFFTAVPRLLEKVYEKIMARGMELTGVKKKLFNWAHDLGLNYKEEDEGKLKLRMARKLVFSKWQEALGGNIKGIVTGAAALNPKLGKIFSAAGIPIREGYGLSETSPVISVNRYEPGGYKFGTVGIPIPGIEVKIFEDGEICIKGPNVMKGYYNKPDLTNEVIDEEGWFHTGDIGEWIDDRFLKITDRKKALFKTSGGKYVAPQVIENKLKDSLYIDQVMVLGNNRKFVSALIVPNYEQLQNFCSIENIEFKKSRSFLEHPKVIELYQNIIDHLNPFFSKTEQVKKFALMDNEWTESSGEMTPSMKIKRKVVEQKFNDLIEALYL